MDQKEQAGKGGTIMSGKRSGKLVEYFNKQPRLGVISTSSKDGLVTAQFTAHLR
jgi:hypothetical protein